MERRSWSVCSPPTLAGSGSCAVGPTARRSSWCIVRARSVYLAVAACAVIVYLGALWNEFVWDDQVIVLGNPLVQTWAGLATAFASPYWPPFVGGYLYRPLTLLTDRKSTRLNSSHTVISYAVFCLKKKTQKTNNPGYHNQEPVMKKSHSRPMKNYCQHNPKPSQIILLQ